MNSKEERSPGGCTRVAKETIAQIAGIAAREVEGVEYPVGSRDEGFRTKNGMKNSTRGVKCRIKGDKAMIDLNLTTKVSANIPMMARQVQDRVQNAVENMTGLHVVAVNVRINRVSYPGEA